MIKSSDTKAAPVFSLGCAEIVASKAKGLLDVTWLSKDMLKPAFAAELSCSVILPKAATLVANSLYTTGVDVLKSVEGYEPVKTS